ncbi:MAG: nuclear transport factor 2 family protein [Rhodospirillaceae bacterium]|nr:MAG: nuclear transport factor 2 family protein [Rhodospirillaceae bacterium]
MTQDDTAAVYRLVTLYALGVDTQRWDLFDEVFTEDVIAEFGDLTKFSGLAKFKNDFAAFHALFAATQHTMSNFTVDFYGDTAQAVTYAHWRLIRYGVPGGETWEGQGWYDDKVIRTPAGWRIQHRICKIVWWGGNPMVNQASPDVSFDLPVTSLRANADAGAFGYLKARKMK